MWPPRDRRPPRDSAGGGTSPTYDLPSETKIQKNAINPPAPRPRQTKQPGTKVERQSRSDRGGRMGRIYICRPNRRSRRNSNRRAASRVLAGSSPPANAIYMREPSFARAVSKRSRPAVGAGDATSGTHGGYATGASCSSCSSSAHGLCGAIQEVGGPVGWGGGGRRGLGRGARNREKDGGGADSRLRLGACGRTGEGPRAGPA